MKHSGG